jgi:VanZ family protein
MLKYLIQYKFSILLAGFIALLSLLPGDSFPDSSLFSLSYLDKMVHAAMYASIALVALLENRQPPGRHTTHLLLLVTLFFMSAVIEILQAVAIATRAAEWLDLLANLLGLFAGYIAFRVLLILRS